MLESITRKGYITPQIAVLAQLVERLLAKQKAAGSRPAYRTNLYSKNIPNYFYSELTINVILNFNRREL